jgi:cation/acetate symporter
MSVRAWTFLLVGLSFSLYLFIAWRTRVRDTHGFYVAGRGVPAPANGMATAADWMSAASFISMAGIISTMGYAGGVYIMGWTGGFVLLALLLAPYLRKFGHFTVPDFIGDRYESNAARSVAVVCAVFVSFTYVAGQMRGVGIVFSRFLEVDIDAGVAIGMAIVFVYATLGGMKGITWTQVAQYWVLITAFLIPAVAISIQLTGVPLPSLGMGADLAREGVPLLARLDGLNAELGFAPYTETFAGGWDRLNVFCTALALMAGTAGLPHVIVRFYTVRSVAAARWSGFWALLFIALLYLTAPATAAFSRYFLIESLQGRSGAELPDWFRHWSHTGLVLWLDDGDGRVRYAGGDALAENELFRAGALGAADLAELRARHERWLRTSGREGEDGRRALRERGLSGPDPDIIVLATPEMAGLASWIVALVAAGGLAAALSTASGLLLVISSSVAHDLYFRMLRPGASGGW